MFCCNWFYFSPLELFLAIKLVLALIYQTYFYLRYMRVVLCRNKKKDKIAAQYTQDQLPVSVIIAARDESANLREFLPEILTQDYPIYEVIVVNDGADEDTEDLLDEYKQIYPHLRTTFVPQGAKNLSTKKLALTLGIKAAQHEWLLFTDADCVPESKHWIASMARNFTTETEFVLGYGAYLQKDTFINRLITYDTLFHALQYLGFAHTGKPYMGVGRNMAYRKEVFFRKNGFASTLHLQSGDDDLMVNSAANNQNTRVETSLNSITWSIPKKNFRTWYFQKERHLSVSTFYNVKSKFLLFVEPFTRLLFYISFILLFALSLNAEHWYLTAIASVLFLIRFFIQATIINKTSRYYKGRKYYLTLLVFDMILPVISAVIMTFGRMGSKSKYINWKQ